MAANVYAAIDAIDDAGLDDTAKVNGSQEAVNEVLNSFDNVANNSVEPDNLHHITAE